MLALAALAVWCWVPPASAQHLPLSGMEGEVLTQEALEHGTTLLVVWASWSPRCRDVVPRINRLAARWSERANVGSVVFQQEPERIVEWLEPEPLDVPVYLDRSGKFSKHYEVTTLPMLLIFKQGEVAFRGSLSGNPDPVIQRILVLDDDADEAEGSASSSRDAGSGLEN